MKRFLIVSIGLFIVGCAGVAPTYKNSKTHFIVFKTPTFRYADQGFIYKASNEKKLEIYSNGVSVMALRVLKDEVCMSRLKCMSKEAFNKNILASSNYPKDILDNILDAKPIFNGKNLKGSNGNFIQNIGTIKYIVNSSRVKFYDSSNGVKIVIK